MDEEDNKKIDIKDAEDAPDSVRDEVSESPKTPKLPKKKLAFYKNKFVVTGAALLVIAVGAVLWFLASDKQDSTDNKPAAQQKILLGAVASVVDGSSQVSTDNVNWQDLKAEAELQEGSLVRASETGRVVIALDDGSAVRVNKSSTVKLSSLAADSVVIDNLSGEVYTRVVESERTFSVMVGDESYVALGTAYKTINKDTAKGVEVYQSEVSVKLSDQKIAEGKRYFQTNAVTELNKVVTDIPLDQLKADEFIKWNLEQDKKTDEFKDKLGYLKALEEAPAPAPAAAPAPKPAASTAGITLTGSKTASGVSFSWKVTGLTATKGFKIVKSKEANPTFGGKTSESAYVSDSAARSYEWKIKDGKTYYFRVCIYTGSSCTNYSNSIQVTAPYVAPVQPTGSLSLVHNSGNSFGWTLSGSAPYGHKLVWSSSANPTYPGSGAKFYNEGSTSSASIDADAGSYYVRVCMYYEGSCVNYSNELYVTIP